MECQYSGTMQAMTTVKAIPVRSRPNVSCNQRLPFIVNPRRKFPPRSSCAIGSSTRENWRRSAEASRSSARIGRLIAPSPTTRSRPWRTPRREVTALLPPMVPRTRCSPPRRVGGFAVGQSAVIDKHRPRQPTHAARKVTTLKRVGAQFGHDKTKATAPSYRELKPPASHPVARAAACAAAVCSSAGSVNLPGSQRARRARCDSPPRCRRQPFTWPMTPKPFCSRFPRRRTASNEIIFGTGPSYNRARIGI